MIGFALGTRILMANGGFRLIEELELKEQVNGGSVTQTCHGLSFNEWELADDEWYKHNGIYVTGGQKVWFEGDWMRVSYIPGAQKTDPHPSFYSIKTTTGRLFSINDTTFEA